VLEVGAFPGPVAFFELKDEGLADLAGGAED
jgi:hypothetical protein